MGVGVWGRWEQLPQSQRNDANGRADELGRLSISPPSAQYRDVT
jgi:hypothetical protein